MGSNATYSGGLQQPWSSDLETYNGSPPAQSALPQTRLPASTHKQKLGWQGCISPLYSPNLFTAWWCHYDRRSHLCLICTWDPWTVAGHRSDHKNPCLNFDPLSSMQDTGVVKFSRLLMQIWSEGFCPPARAGVWEPDLKVAPELYSITLNQTDGARAQRL